MDIAQNLISAFFSVEILINDKNSLKLIKLFGFS